MAPAAGVDPRKARFFWKSSANWERKHGRRRIDSQFAGFAEMPERRGLPGFSRNTPESNWESELGIGKAPQSRISAAA